MKRFGWRLWCCAALAGLLAGCVERRFVVTSDPPGAFVQVDGKPLGAAPADGSFVYYGKYRFTLLRPGFETQQVEQYIPPPWYQYFPLDFVSENLIPWTIQDVRRFHYTLQPQLAPRTDDVTGRAQELRGRAQTLGPAQ